MLLFDFSFDVLFGIFGFSFDMLIGSIFESYEMWLKMCDYFILKSDYLVVYLNVMNLFKKC